MGEFRTTERRQWLLNIARRYEAWRAIYPTFAEAKFLNVLHAEGIAAWQPDLTEARALAASARKATQGLSVGTAADSIGVPRAAFKRWTEMGFPDGAPPLRFIVDGDKRYYDALDLSVFQLWLEEHHV